MTAPTTGQTVSGTNWVALWPHNAQGSATCTLTVGTTQVGSGPCNDSPTTLPWNTTLVPNGTRTLKVTITDTTPRTGTAQVDVNVNN